MPNTKKTKTVEDKVEMQQEVETQAIASTPAKKTPKAIKPTAKRSVPIKSEPATSDQGPTLILDVHDLEGKVVESLALPQEIFGVKVNNELLAQAVRVHLGNARQGTVSTKTRGEVEGSTRKIYRQKGTGRARHGSIRAPIFVHGGRVFGPKPRDYSMGFPKKMKKAALLSALSLKAQEGSIKLIAGLEKIEAKTKNFAVVMDKLNTNGKKMKILVVTNSDLVNVKRAGRNLEGVIIMAAERLNAYDVLNYKQLIIMKDAVETIKKHFAKKEKKESSPSS